MIYHHSFGSSLLNDSRPNIVDKMRRLKMICQFGGPIRITTDHNAALCPGPSSVLALSFFASGSGYARAK